MTQILTLQQRRVSVIGILAVLLTALAVVLLTQGPDESQSLWSRRPTGFPQLVSITPLPEVDGEMCQWVSVSATSSMGTVFPSQAVTGLGQETNLGNTANRPPLRVIHDPSPGYSSVAVDPVRNEVVMTDENLFQILVYDRLTNTPRSAEMSEPKRVISGLNTKIEFQCGVYIDPTSGDIYAVNNDTVNALVIFSRQARGNVPPDREIETPHGTFGVAVDEDAQELFLTVQHDSAVVVYNKMASGEEPPIRLLQGDRTRLADPHGIAVDSKNGLLFVTNHGALHDVSADLLTADSEGATRKANWPLDRSAAVPGSGKLLPPTITVYSLKASGNTPPLRVIEGPHTHMNWPTGIAVDPERGDLFVANDAGDSILVFDASARGDATPIRVLKGPQSRIKNPTGVALDLKNDELWVANFGNHSTTVYKRDASGDTPPLRVIRSAAADKPTLMIGNPGAIDFDTRRGEILVPN